MAISKCIQCGNTTFEMQENSPIGSNFKFMFIQCSSCGGVVGVVDYYNIGQVLKKIAKKLGVSI